MTTLAPECNPNGIPIVLKLSLKRIGKLRMAIHMQSSFMISKYATSSDMAIAYDPTIPFIYV
jgi:hypothetical protein